MLTFSPLTLAVIGVFIIIVILFASNTKDTCKNIVIIEQEHGTATKTEFIFKLRHSLYQHKSKIWQNIHNIHNHPNGVPSFMFEIIMQIIQILEKNGIKTATNKLMNYNPKEILKKCFEIPNLRLIQDQCKQINEYKPILKGGISFYDQSFFKKVLNYQNEFYLQAIDVLYEYFNLGDYTNNSEFANVLQKTYFTVSNAEILKTSLNTPSNQSKATFHYSYLSTDFFNINKTIQLINQNYTNSDVIFILKIDLWMLLSSLSQKYLNLNIMPTFNVLKYEILKLFENIYNDNVVYNYVFNYDIVPKIIFFINPHDNIIPCYFIRNGKPNEIEKKFVMQMGLDAKSILSYFVDLITLFRSAYNNFEGFGNQETFKKELKNKKNELQEDTIVRNILNEFETKQKFGDGNQQKENEIIKGNKSLPKQKNKIKPDKIPNTVAKNAKIDTTKEIDINENKMHAASIYKLVADKIIKNMIKVQNMHQGKIQPELSNNKQKNKNKNYNSDKAIKQ